MNQFDIIIVGGGIVGAIFALDLATQRPDIQIALLDLKEYIPANATILDHRIYAISYNNIEYLKSMNIVFEQNKCGTIKTMDVKGDTHGNIIFNNHTSRIPYLAKTVEYNYLYNQLYNYLISTPNISLLYDELQSIEYNQVNVTLTCLKNTYSTTLIVGADGSHSTVRKYTNIKAKVINYTSSGLVANFACETSPKNTAYQWFTQCGVLAYLPLPNNYISIVWSMHDVQKVLNMHPDQLCELVEDVGQHTLGKLTLITKPVIFPLALTLLNQVYAHKIVLIGDAAHTIHPLAGQGLNLGIGDAKLLAKLLSDYPSYQFGDNAILAKLNGLRILQVKTMQYSCHGLYEYFKQSNPIMQYSRNIGLNLLNSSAMVKRYLINRANK